MLKSKTRITVVYKNIQGVKKVWKIVKGQVVYLRVISEHCMFEVHQRRRCYFMARQASSVK